MFHLCQLNDHPVKVNFLCMTSTGGECSNSIVVITNVKPVLKNWFTYPLHPQSDIRHQQCFLHLSLPFAKVWAYPRCTLILGVPLWGFSNMWYGVFLTFVSLVVSSAKHCLESFHKVFLTQPSKASFFDLC